MKRMLQVTIVCLMMLFGTTAASAKEFDENDFSTYPANCIRDSLETLEEKSLPAKAAPFSILPPTVDLTSQFPAPGNQGRQGSCVSWAVGYAYKTFQEGIEHGWDINNPSHQFSPAFMHNQLTSGENGGTIVSDAMDLLVYRGATTLSDMPYNENDYLTQPTAPQNYSALKYRAESWNSLTGTENIKQRLADGDAVIAEIDVYKDFDDLGPGNEVFDTCEGQSRGGHAICLIGYDDTKQAYKFINSWGTNWGLGGYGYISYALVNQMNYGYVYTMTDANNPPEVVYDNGAGVGTDIDGNGVNDAVFLVNKGNMRVTLEIVLYDKQGSSGNWETWYDSGEFGYCATYVDGRVVGGDFNGDGYGDVAVLYHLPANESQVHVFLSNGSLFEDPVIWYDSKIQNNYTFGVDTILPKSLGSGDFNGDGIDDLIMLRDRGYSTSIVVFPSKGNGFNAYEVWYQNTSFNLPKKSTDVHSVHGNDINSDGIGDISLLVNINDTYKLYRFTSTGRAFSFSEEVIFN